MRNEMIMPMSLVARTKLFIQSVGEGLSQIYSAVMEESVSVTQSWKILHASTALVVTAFFPMSLLLRILAVGWMIYTFQECRKCGLK